MSLLFCDSGWERHGVRNSLVFPHQRGLVYLAWRSHPSEDSCCRWRCELPASSAVHGPGGLKMQLPGSFGSESVSSAARSARESNSASRDRWSLPGAIPKDQFWGMRTNCFYISWWPIFFHNTIPLACCGPGNYQFTQTFRNYPAPPEEHGPPQVPVLTCRSNDLNAMILGLSRCYPNIWFRDC